eukprot:scaffold206172_cov19-Tisochrysis_lutea.AAC.2
MDASLCSFKIARGIQKTIAQASHSRAMQAVRIVACAFACAQDARKCFKIHKSRKFSNLLGVRILRRRRRLGHIPPISSQQEHTDGGGNTRAEDSRWEAGPTGRSYCPALQRWLLQQPPLASQQTQSLLRGRA